MNNRTKKYIGIVCGLILLGIGLYLVKTGGEPQGIMRALPYMLVAFGGGLFGQIMGGIISDRLISSDPEFKRKHDIELGDERNIAIGEKAKAKAFDVMTYVFGALMVSFGLMGADMVVILMLVFSYIFVEGTAIYYRAKFDKEM